MKLVSSSDSHHEPHHQADSGRIILAGVPIGNIGDATGRLQENLTEADIIAAEDTRKLHRLLSELVVHTSAKIVSFYEHNEERKSQELVEAAQSGAKVVVVSDAGMPTISDPGYRLVTLATQAGVPVTVLPGPSAVLMSLALSGLPTDRFTFEGFLPRKNGERAALVQNLAAEQRTMVFFESPHRIADSLAALAEGFGVERKAALCRELTKTYEEVRRGSLQDLIDGVQSNPPRGEITLVVAGSPRAAEHDYQKYVGLVAELIDQGAKLKEAVAKVAAATGASKNILYETVLAERKASQTFSNTQSVEKDTRLS